MPAFDSDSNSTSHLNPSSPRCVHEKVCRGCSHLARLPSHEAIAKKKRLWEGLKDLFQSSPLPSNGMGEKIEYLRAPEFHFRHRVDLQVHNGDRGYSEQRIGLFAKDSNEIFHLRSCPLLVEDLNLYFQEIQKLHFPIRKGSIRLRSFQGKRGIWLDFSNQDIHKLLSEARSSTQSLLADLLKLGRVEIGQRRKRLSADFKLLDPVLETWSETSLAEDKSLPLLNSIAGFTQPGSESNRLLLREYRKFLERVKNFSDKSDRENSHKDWVEFGAGNGNLSLPFLYQMPDRKLLALEFDEVSFLGLKESAKNLFKNIMFQTGDFQKIFSSLDLTSQLSRDLIPYFEAEGLIVNPPRAGVGSFFTPLLSLKPASRPEFVIYISCFLDSFLRDCKGLIQSNYQLVEIKIIDQFPHTEHFEIMALWRKIDSTRETRQSAID